MMKKPKKSWAIVLQYNVTTDFNYIRQEPSIITIRNLYEMKMLSPTQHQQNCQVNLCILISYLLHYLANSWNEFKHYKCTRPVYQGSSNKFQGHVMAQMVNHYYCSQFGAPDTHTTGPNFTLPNTNYAHETCRSF